MLFLEHWHVSFGIYKFGICVVFSALRMDVVCLSQRIGIVRFQLLRVARLVLASLSKADLRIRANVEHQKPRRTPEIFQIHHATYFKASDITMFICGRVSRMRRVMDL